MRVSKKTDFLIVGKLRVDEEGRELSESLSTAQHFGIQIHRSFEAAFGMRDVARRARDVVLPRLSFSQGDGWLCAHYNTENKAYPLLFVFSLEYARELKEVGVDRLGARLRALIG